MDVHAVQCPEPEIIILSIMCGPINLWDSVRSHSPNTPKSDPGKIAIINPLIVDVLVFDILALAIDSFELGLDLCDLGLALVSDHLVLITSLTDNVVKLSGCHILSCRIAVG